MLFSFGFSNNIFSIAASASSCCPCSSNISAFCCQAQRLPGWTAVTCCNNARACVCFPEYRSNSDIFLLLSTPSPRRSSAFCANRIPSSENPPSLKYSRQSATIDCLASRSSIPDSRSSIYIIRSALNPAMAAARRSSLGEAPLRIEIVCRVSVIMSASGECW